MCGLVGIVGQIGEKEKKLFKLMLKLDTIRGPHSTGIVSVNRDGKSQFVKWLGTPWDLPEENVVDYNRIVDNQIQTFCLMGHNRYATKGAVNLKNAHPFDFEGGVGMHNGTLTNTSFKAFNNGKGYEVDSQAMMHNINEKGFKNTYNNLHGAWAISWYDKANKSLNLIRNDRRPLEYCYINQGRTLVYASLGWLIDGACTELSIDIDDDTLYELPINTLGVVSMGAYKHKNSAKIRYKKFFDEVDDPTPVSNVSDYYGYSWFQDKVVDEKKKKLKEEFEGKIIPFTLEPKSKTPSALFGEHAFGFERVKIFYKGVPELEALDDEILEDSYFYGKVTLVMDEDSNFDKQMGEKSYVLLIEKVSVSEPLDILSLDIDEADLIQKGEAVVDSLKEWWVCSCALDEADEEKEGDSLVPFVPTNSKKGTLTLPSFTTTEKSEDMISTPLQNSDAPTVVTLPTLKTGHTCIGTALKNFYATLVETVSRTATSK